MATSIPTAPSPRVQATSIRSLISTNKWYAITITGRNYFFSNFSTVVTPSFNSSAPAPSCGTGSVSGKLLVACYNTGGARVQPPAGFGFGVF